MRIALTIAGSDSSGGAGIQADLKTFHRFGVYGTSAVTAVTAQDAERVRAWSATEPALVAAQIDAVARELRPAAVKSGMLGSPEIVRVTAAALQRHGLRPYVLDPVLAATSGDPLSAGDSARALLEGLVPLAALVTPNLDEAEHLTGLTVRDERAMEHAARELVARGARAVLVKGGHLAGDDVLDLFFDGREVRHFRHARIGDRSVHGTGCALSAAITALLAQGQDMPDAIEGATDWLQAAIRGASTIGEGQVLDFFASR